MVYKWKVQGCVWCAHEYEIHTSRSFIFISTSRGVATAVVTAAFHWTCGVPVPVPVPAGGWAFSRNDDVVVMLPWTRSLAASQGR